MTVPEWNPDAPSELALLPAVAADFGCVPAWSEQAITIAFSGTADMAAVALLGEYLKQVHAEALRLRTIEVRCDFRALAFMNSSCFKAFVVWIDTVKNSPQPYGIRFLTNSGMHWQRRSLEALRRLATSVVSIDG